MTQSPSKEFNGQSIEFVGKVPDELMCRLCMKVLREPRQVVCCGQHYCSGCIDRRIKNNFSCPSCHTSNFNHFRDTHFEQRVNNLKIHCPHQKKGCKWVGEISQIRSHLGSNQGCVFENIACPNKCGQLVPRRDIKEHMIKACALRRVKCQFCNHENTYQVVTGSHSGVCPNYPVKCPNNCGTKGIRRAELSKHEQVCPLKTVSCPFRDAGCKTPLYQKDLGEHMQTSTQQHLKMVTGAFTTLKTRAETAENECQAVRSELEMARSQLQGDKVQQAKMLLAIQSNADELIKSCSESQRVLLHSIRSLTDKSYQLQDMGKPVVFQMINYSDLKRNNKKWYSPPFYVAGGYKMCLAVYANGIGSGRGSCLSIALCLMKGEFDGDLAWPVNVPFNLTVEILKQDEQTESAGPTNPKTYMYFHPDKPQQRVLDGVLVEARICENFARHQVVEEWMLFYDAITFQITPESEFL